MRTQAAQVSASPADPARLARAIERIARSDGDHVTAIPSLSVHRRSAPTEPLHCVYGLGVGVVAQGSKQVLMGSEVIDYAPGQSMLTTIDSPVVAHVTRASSHEPFLGLFLTLDTRLITQLVCEVELPPRKRERACRSISVETLEATLVDALVRLVGLLHEPSLVQTLSPLIQQEITARLLVGPHGGYLQDLVATGSPNQQIAKAVAWLKLNFKQPLQADALASRVHMSPSTFRQHFRAITGTSPLQFQKQLRLQEARQLMLNQNVDAGNASGLVGYESPSQFSREYSRLFGEPPQRDIKRMRPA
ncbi:AraC family transcriptional regulator [Lysobacter capsici]|uniref:AraC family transcriptional regulator n=1 Tax=Lysobacter capsici TaxID=435897 RepID=UPI00177F1D67|nr:AraC family transcriptional regulator [Lysobacter capsici]UOF14825.1 AraC family transcriptional regulator [Lysobacter capsici]